MAKDKPKNAFKSSGRKETAPATPQAETVGQPDPAQFVRF